MKIPMVDLKTLYRALKPEVDERHNLKEWVCFRLGNLVYGRYLFAGCFKRFVGAHLVKEETRRRLMADDVRYIVCSSTVRSANRHEQKAGLSC